jgi:hypothetical protein
MFFNWFDYPLIDAAHRAWLVVFPRRNLLR